MACAECGHATREAGEFHPHVFCVLKKAGRTDPWADLRWINAQLGIDLPKKPPLVRNLPLKP